MAMENESKHVAVLTCDTPFPGITEKYGDFGDNVIDMLKKAGTCKYPCRKYQVAFSGSGTYEDELREVYVSLEEGISNGSVVGVVLSGSRSDAFAEGVQWIERLDRFLKAFLFARDRFPIVGICFGHQIIAKNLGCKVGRNAPEIGWECGTSTISLNNDILNIENSPFTKTLNDENGCFVEHVNLVQMHQDIVFNLPPPDVAEKRKTTIKSIGSTNKCSIQGLVTDSGPLKILTFQGHPEFSSSECVDILNKIHEAGSISTNFHEKCIYNTGILNNQGSLIGKAIGIYLSSFDS